MKPKDKQLPTVSKRLNKVERKPELNLEAEMLRVQLGIKGRIWTDRMLAALVNGVKGGKWFSLIDKVYNPDNLYQAWLAVKKNQGRAGIDDITIGKFEEKIGKYIDSIEKRLKEGTYEPQLILRVFIPKDPNGKELRGLGIPVVRDRLVQAAIKQIIEPIFEYDFEDTSYGFRPGRGCHDALREVQMNLNQGYHWIVDADLKSYFDTIPHEKLMERVREKIGDGEVLKLIEGFLKAGIFENLKTWTPDQGTPQGGVLSPLLANVYLHPLDKMMRELGIRMIRYADDFVIMCKSEEEAKRALELTKIWVKENGLTLHPAKTKLSNCLIEGQGFEFLGYRFEARERYVRRKSMVKFKDRIRGYTKRNKAGSLEEIIGTMNKTLRGWFNYFKYAHHWTFGSLDGWIRRRLRALLRRRLKKKGMGKTHEDHKKWPNAYFAKAGLFSLKGAYEQTFKTT